MKLAIENGATHVRHRGNGNARGNRRVRVAQNVQQLAHNGVPSIPLDGR
jgi:hypothetical protein